MHCKDLRTRKELKEAHCGLVSVECNNIGNGHCSHCCATSHAHASHNLPPSTTKALKPWLQHHFYKHHPCSPPCAPSKLLTRPRRLRTDCSMTARPKSWKQRGKHPRLNETWMAPGLHNAAHVGALMSSDGSSTRWDPCWPGHPEHLLYVSRAQKREEREAMFQKQRLGPDEIGS